MRKARKLAALLAGVLMATTVTGCSNTKYAMKADGEEIKAGIYIGYLQEELINQVNTLYYQGITEDPLSQQVEGEGMTVSEYSKQQAIQKTKEYYAVKKQFEAEGLSFTDEEIESMNSYLKTAWESSGEMLEEIGVSKDSYKEIYRHYLRYSSLFSHYFSEGGSKAPSEDEMVTYINDSYLRYKVMSFYKSSSEDEAAKETENKEAEEKRDHYYEIGKEMTFDEFDQLIEMKQDDDQAEADAASEAADESADASGDESSSADASADESSVDESTADESSVDESSVDESSIEESSADESSADESSADESTADESSADESTEDESSDTDSESEEEAAEEDPYVNETMTNFGALKEDALETDSGKLYQFIHDAEANKVLTFENDTAYYIIIKGDVTERSKEYLDDNHTTILNEMKGDEFDGMVKEWIEAIDFSNNEKALTRYSPETIYKRITDFNEKKSKTTAKAAS